jgi:hypothetical protein
MEVLEKGHIYNCTFRDFLACYAARLSSLSAVA